MRWPQSVEIKGFFGKKRCMFRTRPARPESVGHDAAPGQAGARNGDAGGRPFVCFQRGGQAWQKAASQVEEEQNADAGRGDQQRCLHRQKGEGKPDGEEEKNVHTASVQVKVPGMRPCGPCRFRKAYTECRAVFGKAAFFCGICRKKARVRGRRRETCGITPRREQRGRKVRIFQDGVDSFTEKKSTCLCVVDEGSLTAEPSFCGISRRHTCSGEGYRILMS